MSSSAPTPLETTQGYVPPTVTQFSVFMNNKVGKLLDMVEGFDDSDCSICAISVHEASDHAVVRIITNKARKARELLREHRLAFGEMDVLVVELTENHTLTSMCLSLLGAELNIMFAYPLMIKPNGRPTIALAVDDPNLAGQILRRKQFRLFGELELPCS
ncbi:MAG: acetolactate synthase [Planctomycetota bacterium]